MLEELFDVFFSTTWKIVNQLQGSLNLPIAGDIPFETMTIGVVAVEEFPISRYRQRIENYMTSEDGDDVLFNLFIQGTTLAAIFNEQEIEERFADQDNGIEYRGFIIFSDYNIQLPAVDGENDITFIDGNMYVYLSPRPTLPCIRYQCIAL